MSLEKVGEEIIKTAQQEASKIRAEAKKAAKDIENKAKVGIKEMEERKKTEAEKELASLRERELSSAELETQKAVLNTKKKVIDKVFQKAGDEIRNTTSSKREKQIQSLLKIAKDEIDVGMVICRKEDAGFVKGYKSKINDMDGGIIVETKDGKVTVDLSYESILQTVREKSIQNVATILFST